MEKKVCIIEEDDYKEIKKIINTFTQFTYNVARHCDIKGFMEQTITDFEEHVKRLKKLLKIEGK